MNLGDESRMILGQSPLEIFGVALFRHLGVQRPPNATACVSVAAVNIGLNHCHTTVVEAYEPYSHLAR
jgi:hypothetical protein